MYQQPAGSRIVDESTYGAGTSSSNVARPKKNSHLTRNLSVGSIHSPNYRLPPPPSYFGPHLIEPAGPTEPKYLSNWCVNVKSVTLEQGDSSLIAALSGKYSNIFIFKCLGLFGLGYIYTLYGIKIFI